MLATGAHRTGRVFSATVVALVLLALAGGPSDALAAPNDAFASAQLLTNSSTTATGNNSDATKEPGEPNHAGNGGGHSVWWRWTAPADGAIALDTCDSTFDTLLAVYVGDDVTALAGVAASDDGCETGGGQSRLTFTVTAGQSYAIAVDGRDGDTGDVRLRLRPALNVTAIVTKHKNAFDETRFTVEFAAGEDFAEPPGLKLTRNGRTQTFDLSVDGERVDDTTYTFTFTWSCDRHGAWTWSVTSSGVTQTGSFTVAGCEHSRWFVSRDKVKRGFANDFGKAAAKRLRCSPVGKRKGAKAAKWRCTMVRPGFRCTGSFFFRFELTRQGGEIVTRRRTPSGSITCRS